VKNLFLKYLQNKCSSEEIKQVLELVQTSEGRSMFDQLLQETTLDATPQAAAPSEQIWQRIYTSSTQNINLTTEKEPVRVRVRPLWSTRLGRAAAVLIPLLVAGWWYLARSVEQKHRTAYGQTQEITLPDGSLVVLNGNSTLTYQSDWNPQTAREVWLTGEAFFKVTHQSNHQRFLVHTRREHVIEVLGTEFNVNDRLASTRVVLQSGKIKLTLKQNEAQKSIVLAPGQLVEIDTTMTRPRINEVKTELFTSWRQRKLVFEGTRLAEIALLLKDTYNLNIRVNNPQLLEEKVTGTIPADNVTELINALSIALQVKYVQKDNTIQFF
jgi:transmembrane sensor